MLISNLKGDKMGKYYFIIIFIFNFLFSNYLDIQYASFSYTIGGSYGSCVKFKKSQYNFNSYNACSCAWAANVSNYSDCYELYYNPQTKMIKYNLYEGGEYIYRNFASDYSCHIYVEEIESPILDCDEMNEIECGNDNSCEWVENSQSYNCSQFNSSDECNSYGQYGCYTSWNSTTWQDDCFGGSFTIDDSYCQEIVVDDECSSTLQLECESSENCEWVSDVQIGSCSEFDQNSDVCESTPGCYGAYQYPGWYSGWYCAGGSYQIDINYCQETQIQECNEEYEFQCDDGSCIPIHRVCNDIIDCEDGSDEINCEDCSEMNETECSGDDNCQWMENIELESCNDINSQQECNAVGCSWYNGGYYACTICCWGEYEIDNSYCEEFEYQSGDLNQDNIINIQDIIITVNLVLNSNYDILADMNNDNIVNVLDIIQLVNIILN